MKTLSLFALLMLAGCAGIGSSMSPEQMAQNVKDKNAVVACGSGSGPWGRVVTVYVDTNKINDNNTVSVDSECKVNVTGTKQAVKP
jgi:uncharacterized protein YceK